MADNPEVKIPRARLYKMVSIPRGAGATVIIGDKVISGGGYSSVVKSLNSLGATVNSIAIIAEGINYGFKKSVKKYVDSANTIEKVQDKITKKEDKRKKDFDALEKRRRSKEKDAESEKKQEKGLNKFAKGFTKIVQKGVMGFWQAIAKVAESVFRGFVLYGMLDWISKNSEKMQKIVEGIVKLLKFFWRLTEMFVGVTLGGLVKFLENPTGIKGLLGLAQFFAGMVPIFVGMAFLKSPVKTVKGLAWVIGSIGKIISNLVAGTKIAKVMEKLPLRKLGGAFAGGAVAAIAANIDSEGDLGATLGAGAGATAGALAGEALGSKLAGPIGGAIGGALGGIAGGAIGGKVGEFLTPIIDPIKRFFGKIGEIFNAVLGTIKEPIGKFFQLLGGLMTKMMDIIEPHLPLISKIVGGIFKGLLSPFFLVLDGLIKFLEFFAGSSSAPKQRTATTERAYGGKVVVPQMAEGGTISNELRVAQLKMNSLQAGLAEAMLLPFKAIGIGIVGSISAIGGMFGSFLPAPIKMLLGSILGPIASMFGVPASVMNTIANKGLKFVGGVAEGIGNAGREMLQKVIGGEQSDSVLSLLKRIHRIISGEETPPQKSIGGTVDGYARGGWIRGPQTGYPVSLDGGRSVSFIGHGTEWVGLKGRAAGGTAFVVPFNTPATQRSPHLTKMRMNQARAGGYALPRGFSVGGAVTPTIPKFAAGGKAFISQSGTQGVINFNKTKSKDDVKLALDSSYANTTDVVLGGKTYYARYNPYTGNVLQVTKRVSGSGFMNMQNLTSLHPTKHKDEFDRVAKSAFVLKEINNRRSGIRSELQARLSVTPKSETAKKAHERIKDLLDILDKEQIAIDKPLTQAKVDTGRALQEYKERVDDRVSAAESAAAGGDTAQSEDQQLDQLLTKLSEDLSKAFAPSSPSASSGSKLDEGQTKVEAAIKDKKDKAKAQAAASNGNVAAIAKAKPAIIGAPGAGSSDIVMPNAYQLDANKYLAPKFGMLTDNVAPKTNLW
jgi:hypothetical protein